MGFSLEFFIKIRYNIKKSERKGEKMSRYTTILFDADNTLLDFTRSERDALIDTLHLMGIVPDEEMIAKYSAINDAMWKKLERGEIEKAALRVARFEEFARCYGWQLDVCKMASSYTDFLSQKAYLMDGALETCRCLAAHCKLYVITNGLKFVQERRFSATPLAPLFLGAFISEEMGAEKPHKAYFDEVASRIPSFLPEKTLIVGDSLSSDICGGINVGIDTCWFNPKGGAVPENMPITYVVQRLEEILPLVLD